MTPSSPAELGPAEIKRGAAVLLYLLTWRGGFGNDEAMRALREAKLDAAIVVTTQGLACVDEAVLTAFRALAGRSAVGIAPGRFGADGERTIRREIGRGGAAAPWTMAPVQAEAARGLLGWSRKRLGAMGGRSADTGATYERYGRLTGAVSSASGGSLLPS